MFEKLFKLKKNNTTIKTEIIAGITTFMTMAYILAVNPNILGAAGMDKSAILIATALASFIGCLAMAIFANYPFALAPGMGLNAYFASTVCGIMGIPWQMALFAVFIEGIIFIVLSVTNVRDAIPANLKVAVSGGIGLFIAIIGFINARIAVDAPGTLLKVRDFSENFHSEGIGAILALIGVIITAVLLIRKVKGGILFGILATWILGIIAELTGLYVPNPDESIKMYSTIPDAIVSFNLSPLKLTAGQAFTGVNFDAIRILDFVVVILAFLFVDIFDTLGTLIGVSTKADMLDKDGKLPRIKGALFADAIATTAGAALGTSTTTTFVESSAGVAAGGRTGLASFVTAILFLLCLFIAPLAQYVPSCATAPALIYVGLLMSKNICNIDFKDFRSGATGFITFLMMIVTYSISNGIMIGAITYVLISLLTKQYTKKDIIVTIIAVLGLLRFAFITM